MAGDEVGAAPARPPAPRGPGREAELERRLGELAAENAELFTELRFLRQELTIRGQYVAELEADLASAQALAAHHALAVAEFDAYRSRMAHRVVDAFVTRLRRYDLLYGIGRRLGRLAFAIRSIGGSVPPAGRGRS